MRIPGLILLLLAGLLVAAGPSGCYHYDDDDDCRRVDDDDFFDDDDFDDDDFFDDDDDNCNIFITEGGVIIITSDAPSDAIRSLYVTFEEMTLLSDEVGPQLVFHSEEGVRVDVLSLRRGAATPRLHEVINQAQVEAATYRGLNVLLRDPVLVLDSGEVIDGDGVNIASGGRVDLEFPERVPVGPADVLFIDLDFDVERSVSSSTEAWNVHPVIDVGTFREHEAPERILAPTEIRGRVIEVDDDEPILEVELPDAQGALEVEWVADSSVLDDELEVVEFESIRAGDEVTVRGVWNTHGRLDASVIVIGSTKTVRGTITEVLPDPTGDGFTLVLDEQRGPSPLRTLAAASTSLVVPEAAAITWHRSAPATADALTVGRTVTVLASELPDIGETRVALIDIAPAIPETPTLVTGTIVAIDDRRRTIVVEQRPDEADEGELQLLELGEKSRLLLIRQGTETRAHETTILENVQLGMFVEAELDADGSPSLIVVTAEGQ